MHTIYEPGDAYGSAWRFARLGAARAQVSLRHRAAGDGVGSLTTMIRTVEPIEVWATLRPPHAD